MSKLDEKDWRKVSVFGKKGFLSIATTGSSIDAIKLKPGANSDVPYVTRSDSTNGVARFVSDANYEYGSDEGNCITVGLDTQTAFYQPHKFVTGQNIQVITGSAINKDTAPFLISILRNQMRAKFNWGGNGATLSRMKTLEAMMPFDDHGELDFGFVADYTSSIRGGLLMRYKEFVAGQLAELEYKEIPSLAEKEWQPFTLDAIFSVSGGKRLETRNKIPGKRPFIGATDNGNGITGFVGNDNKSKDSNVLGVNYNGAPCIAFYHPYECVFTDDVKRLHLIEYDDNKYVLLFFTSVFAQQRCKYSYGYKFKERRMLKQKLMLPVNDTGDPDYEYMEQYTKNMMLRKYQQYLDYLNNQDN